MHGSTRSVPSCHPTRPLRSRRRGLRRPPSFTQRQSARGSRGGGGNHSFAQSASEAASAAGPSTVNNITNNININNYMNSSVDASAIPRLSNTGAIIDYFRKRPKLE